MTAPTSTTVAQPEGGSLNLDFAAALRLAENDVPAGIVGPDHQVSVRRFGVYRNNVSSSLIEALGDNFPVVKMLVGQRFFEAVAQVYHRQNYPRVPMLFRYGAEFPGFLEDFEPVQDVPYLPDVARLEWAWLQAFHAADIPPMPGDALAALPQERLHEAVFEAHPASALVTSRWPVATILANHKQGGDLTGVDMAAAETALVTRADVNVEIRTLPEGGGQFLNALMSGEPLGIAAECATQASASFDLASNIAGMLQAGVFTGLSVPVDKS